VDGQGEASVIAFVAQVAERGWGGFVFAPVVLGDDHALVQGM
jgi:hypothetical protein